MAATRHKTSCSEVQLNLQKFLQDQSLHSKRGEYIIGHQCRPRNPKRTSKFRPLKPYQWSLYDLVIKARESICNFLVLIILSI